MSDRLSPMHDAIGPADLDALVALDTPTIGLVAVLAGLDAIH